MIGYKHILVAVELLPSSDAELIKTAQEAARKFGADVTLIHAIEYISSYGAAYGIVMSADMENKLLDNAKIEMKKLAQVLQVPEIRQVIKFGPAKFVILDTAETNQCDLIIVGSHGRSGLKALLGSTANAVLHGAKCDVLSVRFKG